MAVYNGHLKNKMNFEFALEWVCVFFTCFPFPSSISQQGIGEDSGCQQLRAAFVVAFVLSALTQNACGPLGLKS